MWEDWNAEPQLAWERAVFSRIRRGDAEAFGLLYDVFARRLVRHILAPRLASKAEIEDALAETFRRAFEARARYVVGDTSAYFWLARIAERIALDTRRAEKRSVSFMSLFAREATTPAEDPSEAYVQKERALRERARVDRALDVITPRYRVAIELRILEERPREECAERLGLRVATFDVLLLRAVRSLTKALAEVDHDH